MTIQYKKFASNVGLVGITRILVTLRGFLLLPLITKILGGESYGMWILVIVTLTMLSYVFTLGLPFSLVRFMSGNKSNRVKKELFYSSFMIVLVASLIVSVALFFLAPMISSILFNDMTELVILMALVFPFYSINLLFLNYFRALLKMKLYSFGILFQNYVLVFMVYYFILNDLGLYESVFSILVTNVILFCILLVLIIKDIGITMPSFSRIKKLLNFGIPTIPSNFASWITNSGDRYLLAMYLGVGMVGVYSPAYMLGFMLSIFSAPLVFVLPSILSDMYDKNQKKEVRKYLSLSAKLVIFISIPALAGLALFSRDVLEIIATEAIASEGYLIVPIVGAGALFWGISAVYSQTIVLAKRTKLIGGISILVSLINLMLNIVLIPIFGMIGAAFATIGAFFILAAITVHYSKRFLRFKLDRSFLAKSIFSSIIMYLAINLLRSAIDVNIVILFGMIVLGILLYFGSMIMLKAGSLSMVRNVWKIFTSRS